ncbi:hypothetical protein QUB10_33410 [Microcoleus sp. B5-D4]|uniref:hypothetical protein n=1 Tax=Microcoleus sp. B5-D4 TaxID=2818681 RepID=UPI002FD47571
MKTKKLDFSWIEEIEALVKSPRFCQTLSACQALLEEANSLIPTSHMKFVKLNLSLAVDLIEVCRKQLFRLVQLRRRNWFT